MKFALVVDDSTMDRRLAGTLLKRAAFEVMYATHGAEALERIGERVPDIVVTDMQMPEMDGLRLVQEVRTQVPHVPVILMTAHGSEELAVKALQHGAASYVPKRSLAHDLVATVNNVLELSRARQASLRLVEHLDQIESRFVIRNDLTAVADIVGYLEADLTRLHLCDDTVLIQIGVALREALVNAICHGNLELSSALREVDGGSAYHSLAQQRSQELPYRDRHVSLIARVTRAEVTYIVTDDGPGFDPGVLPDPTDAAQLEQASGRGLLLIRTFMDAVSHNKRGNEITMVKHLCLPSRIPPPPQ